MPNFGLFFAIPNFRGWAFQKLYLHYHACLAAHRVEMFVTLFLLTPKL